MNSDTTCEGVRSDQDADQLRDAMVDEVIVQREWLGLVPPCEVEAASPPTRTPPASPLTWQNSPSCS